MFVNISAKEQHIMEGIFMTNTKNLLRTIVTVILCLSLCSFANYTVFAKEHNTNEVSLNRSSQNMSEETLDEANNQPLASSNSLAEFSGVYYGWLEVPFTVTDSSRLVKILYSAKSLNGTDMVTTVGIRSANSSINFWQQVNKPGNSQIYSVGNLESGNYILTIKTNQNVSGYAITGQVYYFI